MNETGMIPTSYLRTKYLSVRHSLNSMHMPLIPKTLADFLVLMASSGGVRFLGFLTSVILAGQLGPQSFGEFAIFFAFMTSFWTATAFIDAAYVRYAATAGERERDAYLKSSMALKVACCLLLAALSFPVSWILSHHVFHKPELGPPIAIAIVCGALLNLLALRTAIYQAAENFSRVAGLNALFYAFVFTAVLALLLGKITTTTSVVYAIYFMAALLVGGVSLLYLFREIGPPWDRRATLIQLLNFSKWLFAANLLYLVYQRLDLWILAYFVDLDKIGQYGIALRMALIASLMTGNLSLLFLPRASRTSLSTVALKGFLRHATLVSSGVVLVIALLWLAAPTMVSWLLGNAYEEAISLTRIMLLGTACIAIYTPLSQLFLTDTSPRKVFYLGLVKLNTTLWLSLWWLPSFGIWGVAWAMTFAELLALVYTLLVLKTKLRGVFEGGGAP